MADNVKVAKQLLRMHENEEVITVASLTKASGVHLNNAGQFLLMWKLVGWLTRQRGDGKGTPFIYSLTEEGVKGLSRLIRE